MKPLTQNPLYRLSVTVLAASLAAACGEKSSPTGVSALPATQQINASDTFADSSARVAPRPDAPPVSNNNAHSETEDHRFTCADFDEVKLRAVARGTDVVVHYRIRVKRPAFYSIRFWPDGRHVSTPIDHAIGQLAEGEEASGEFVALSFDDLDQPITLNYQVDVDVIKNIAKFQRGDEIDGQCDRGGQLELVPELDPECAMTQVSFGEMTAENPAGLEGTDHMMVRVSVEAIQFEGSAELEWRGMGHIDVVARSEISAKCGKQRVELSWLTDGLWLRHAVLTLRVLDLDGNVVYTHTYTGGDFLRDRPETWTLS